MTTTKHTSIFYLTRSLIGAVIKTFHVNAYVGLFFKGLDGSHILLMSQCSSHRISTFLLISPTQFSLHIHTPSYIAQAGWRFFLFKQNRFLIFVVIHFIMISYKSLVSSWDFLRECLADVLFLTKNGISIKITCFFISKKSSGKMQSSSSLDFSLNLSLNCFMTLLINQSG